MRLPATPIESAALADLLEVPRTPLEVREGVIRLDLAGSDIETVGAIVASPLPSAARAALGPESEAAQPVYSRYWLHNRGPAPMGFLPVTVALTPLLARAEAGGGAFEVTWVVSSQYVDASVDVDTALDLPPGWSASFAGAPVTVAASGYARFRSSVSVPADAEPGQYAVAAWVRRGGDAGVEVVEDVATVFVGDSPALAEALRFAMPTAADLGRGAQFGTTDLDRPRPTGLTVDVDASSVRAPAGGGGTFVVRLGNQTRSQIRGELQLASPWGTWTWVRDPTRGFRVEAGSTLDMVVEVRPPSDTWPGHAWVLPKVMWFGRAQYAPTVRIEVGP
jgi:hypothetical protein